MAYVDGVVVPVPVANRDAYLAYAAKAAEVFKNHGALSVVECWGHEVPEGTRTSMNTAVLREEDEAVCLSWIMWPSKAARDEAWRTIMETGEIGSGEMPFDGSRLIYGGFDVVLER